MHIYSVYTVGMVVFVCVRNVCIHHIEDNMAHTDIFTFCTIRISHSLELNGLPLVRRDTNISEGSSPMGRRNLSNYVKKLWQTNLAALEIVVCLIISSTVLHRNAILPQSSAIISAFSLVRNYV